MLPRKSSADRSPRRSAALRGGVRSARHDLALARADERVSRKPGAIQGGDAAEAVAGAGRGCVEGVFAGVQAGGRFACETGVIYKLAERCESKQSNEELSCITETRKRNTARVLPKNRRAFQVVAYLSVRGTTHQAYLVCDSGAITVR